MATVGAVPVSRTIALAVMQPKSPDCDDHKEKQLIPFTLPISFSLVLLPPIHLLELLMNEITWDPGGENSTNLPAHSHSCYTRAKLALEDSNCCS